MHDCTLPVGSNFVVLVMVILVKKMRTDAGSNLSIPHFFWTSMETLHGHVDMIMVTL